MKQKILPCFWPYTKGLKRFFALAVLAAFFSILFSFLTPQIIRLTVDSVIGEEPFALPAPLMDALEALGGRAALRSHLGLTAAAVLACALSEGLFTLSYRLLISHTTESYMKRLRDAIFRHIQHLPFRWHTQNRTGDIIQRCTSDMDIIRNFVANQMIELIRIVILASTALFLMSRMM